MGGRQTKIEGSYLSGTPSAQFVPLQGINRIEQTIQSGSDPRSPSGIRTPINLSSQRVCTSSQLVAVEVVQKTGSENAFDILRKRFLKGFSYQDPRSPSLQLNRTPLVFEDSHDRTLDLDDTFADLFVESNGADPLVKDVHVDDDAEMPECSLTTNVAEEREISSITPQQEFDPRSPSIGVERTPIILCDDDNDANEDVFLEKLLSTLTLNLDASANSSFVSLTSSDAIEGTRTDENNVLPKAANKHLDRVRIAKKTISKGPHRRQKRILHQKIYEDCENQLPLSPQIKSNKIDIINSPKGTRTPLSCMRNRSQQRSRSVESSVRSVNTNFSLKRFDDTLNPSEINNVANIRVMCDESQDSLKF